MDWRSRLVVFILVLSLIFLICGVAFAYDTPEIVAIQKQNQMYGQDIAQSQRNIEQWKARILMNLGKIELLQEQEFEKNKLDDVIKEIKKEEDKK